MIDLSGNERRLLNMSDSGAHLSGAVDANWRDAGRVVTRPYFAMALNGHVTVTVDHGTKTTKALGRTLEVDAMGLPRAGQVQDVARRSA